MMKTKFFIAFLCLMSAVLSTEATIKITSFLNESPLEFNTMTDDGRLFVEGLIIDKEGATLSSKDGKCQIIFEDADKSGFHRPHWKFHVWVKMTDSQEREAVANIYLTCYSLRLCFFDAVSL
ncbi:MAG: hypothetical protein LLG04_14340 [Parachlamydia sp.]|nr:hypothetical protein [Parachlamydia sp.]